MLVSILYLSEFGFADFYILFPSDFSNIFLNNLIEIKRLSSVVMFILSYKLKIKYIRK